MRCKAVVGQFEMIEIEDEHSDQASSQTSFIDRLEFQ
jgi:hypothetical protein